MSWNGNYQFSTDKSAEPYLLAFVREAEGGWLGAWRKGFGFPWNHVRPGKGFWPSAPAAKLAVEDDRRNRKD